jgi:hypothetical protein
MSRLAILCAVTSLSVHAAPQLKALPDNIHATRVKSGTFVRLLFQDEVDAAGNKTLRLILDDGPTAVQGGWYFTNLGYERFLTITSDMQVELEKLRAIQENCAQPTVVTVTSPSGGFSAQTVVLAFLAGMVMVGVVAIGLNVAR